MQLSQPATRTKTGYVYELTNDSVDYAYLLNQTLSSPSLELQLATV
jgi:hypothetical protein